MHDPPQNLGRASDRYGVKNMHFGLSHLVAIGLVALTR